MRNKSDEYYKILNRILAIKDILDGVSSLTLDLHEEMDGITGEESKLNHTVHLAYEYALKDYDRMERIWVMEKEANSG